MISNDNDNLTKLVGKIFLVTAKIHYTSNHIVCLDFVWIATQRPKIVWIDPN